MSFRLDPANPKDRELMAKLKTPSGMSVLDKYGEHRRETQAQAQAQQLTVPNRTLEPKTTMQFCFDYPPSTNHLYVFGRDGRRHLSKVARAYKIKAAQSAVEQGCFIIEGKVEMTAKVYRPRRGSGDLTNRIKLVEDALKGLAWNDDEQVAIVHLYRYYSPKNPRIELTISEIIKKTT